VWHELRKVLQRYRLLGGPRQTGKVLGGFAVALQDCKRGEVHCFSHTAEPARREYHVSAEIKHARRERSIRRIMEVDASVLLHSWSLAAAATTGRMIDVRSTKATARAALFRPDPASSTYTDLDAVQRLRRHP
jgi:hypothetical protein